MWFGRYRDVIWLERSVWNFFTCERGAAAAASPVFKLGVLFLKLVSWKLVQAKLRELGMFGKASMEDTSLWRHLEDKMEYLQ